MEYSCNELLIQLLKQYLTDNCTLSQQQLSQQQVKEMYTLSCKHDVAHLVGVAAEKLPPEQREAFRPFAREQMKAMFRHEKTQRETDKIYGVFEACAIPFIPLKGSVIRSLYHEPWHRTSCDIDILVRKEQLDEAVAALQAQLHYEKKGQGTHDVSMWSPNGVHLELHFDIDETHVTSEQFWDNSAAEAGRYCHRLSNEMLITAHIAHMAKHFLHGGCGLRPFLDLWFMEEKLTYDASCVGQMLCDAGLDTFSEKTHTLMRVWFSDEKADALIHQMEEYILPSGVYGNTKNMIAVARTQGSGACEYLLQRILPPLEILKLQYPALNKHPWLLPWYWICRAIRLVKNGKAFRIGTEYRINRDFSDADRNNTDHLLKGLGLKG